MSKYKRFWRAINAVTRGRHCSRSVCSRFDHRRDDDTNNNKMFQQFPHRPRWGEWLYAPIINNYRLFVAKTRQRHVKPLGGAARWCVWVIVVRLSVSSHSNEYGGVGFLLRFSIDYLPFFLSFVFALVSFAVLSVFLARVPNGITLSVCVCTCLPLYSSALFIIES